MVKVLVRHVALHPHEIFLGFLGPGVATGLVPTSHCVISVSAIVLDNRNWELKAIEKMRESPASPSRTPPNALRIAGPASSTLSRDIRAGAQHGGARCKRREPTTAQKSS